MLVAASETPIGRLAFPGARYEAECTKPARRRRYSNCLFLGFVVLGVCAGFLGDFDGFAGRGTVGGGAEILDWPADREAEVAGYCQGPIGLTQELAREDYHVGFAFVQDGVGLVGVGDHADGTGEDSGALADLVGERDLVAGGSRNSCVGDHAAGGTVNQIHSEWAEKFGECDRLFDVPAAGNPIAGGDADEQRVADGPDTADGGDDFAEETRAILEGAAVGIGTLVGEGREELVEQVAVRGMDFDYLETCLLGTRGGGSEILNDFLDSGGFERGGLRIGFGEGDGAGGYGFPAACGFGDEPAGAPGRRRAGFASSVSQLDAGNGALAQEKMRDAGEEADVIVFPDAEILGADAAFRGDGAGFCEDEGGASDGAAAEVDEVPVVREAIDAGILAHGGDNDAVAEKDVTNL